VECWLDWSHTTSGLKSYEFPDFDSAPTFGHGQPVLKQYLGVKELHAWLEEDKVDAVIALNTPVLAFGTDLPKTRSKWIGIQHNFDYFMQDTPEGIASMDLSCTYSEHWSDLAEDYFHLVELGSSQNGSGSESNAQTVVTGFPQLDQLDLINRRSVREKLGIPKEQQVILLLPYPTFRSPSFWDRRIYRGKSFLQGLFWIAKSGRFEYIDDVLRRQNDQAVVSAIRRFCDNNDAFLLVKSRKKDPIPPYTEDAADLCIYDEDYYPCTIMEAMSVASICISFYSMAVTESAYCGVPHLCISPDLREHQRHLDNFNDPKFEMLFNKNEGGPFQFEGVSTTMDIPDVISNLPKMTLSDFEMDPDARKRYVKKFLGFDDGKSSSRVFEAVQDLLGRQKNPASVESVSSDDSVE